MVRDGSAPHVQILSDAPLSGAEAQAAYDLVEDMQRSRETWGLMPEDVPAILLPYQVAWHQDLRPVRVAKKSRRIGFSWGALAAESVLEAMAASGGMDQHYMGYNQGMAAEYIGDCGFFARAFGAAIRDQSAWRTQVLVDNERQDILRYKVTFSSGHKIEAHSSNPHNWRGRKGHARIDEAAFHPDLMEVLKGAMAFLMWGGRVDIVSTMNGEDNPFFALCRDIQAGQFPRYSLHAVTFKQALSAGFYRRVCLVQGKDWSADAETAYEAEIRSVYPSAEDAAEELDCVAKRGSGAYFTRLLIEKCFEAGVPTIRFAKPAEFVLQSDRLAVVDRWISDVLRPVVEAMASDRRTVFGQDFGRSGDLSVIWPLQEVRPGLWRTPFLLELRNIPFDCQQRVVFWLLDRLPLLQQASFDGRGNGQSHAEAAMQYKGAGMVQAVMASRAYYAEHFPRYRQAFEDGAILVPASEDVVADHRGVVLSKGCPVMSETRMKGSDGQMRHGDSAIAGLLAWAATESDGPSAGATVPPAERVSQSPNTDPLLPRPRFGLVGRLLARRSVR